MNGACFRLSDRWASSSIWDNRWKFKCNGSDSVSVFQSRWNRQPLCFRYEMWDIAASSALSLCSTIGGQGGLGFFGSSARKEGLFCKWFASCAWLCDRGTHFFSLPAQMVTPHFAYSSIKITATFGSANAVTRGYSNRACHWRPYLQCKIGIVVNI